MVAYIIDGLAKFKAFATLHSNFKGNLHNRCNTTLSTTIL